MRCPYRNEEINTVLAYLRRTGKTVICLQGDYCVASGKPKVGIINQALNDRAISVHGDGSILICGASVRHIWDMARTRRRVEEHLRKSASDEEIIRIAVCLGLN
jgi:hypothetical protein